MMLYVESRSHAQPSPHFSPSIVGLSSDRNSCMWQVYSEGGITNDAVCG